MAPQPLPISIPIPHHIIEHYIPNFKNFTKQRALDIILRELYIDNLDLLSLNTTLTIAVQNYIIQTERFAEYSPPPSNP